MTSNRNAPSLYDPTSSNYLAHESPAMRRAVLQQLAFARPYSQMDEDKPLQDYSFLPKVFYPAKVYFELDHLSQAVSKWVFDVARKNPLLFTLEGGEPAPEDVGELEDLSSPLSLWLYDEAYSPSTLAAVERNYTRCRAWAGKHSSRCSVACSFVRVLKLLRECHAMSSTGNLGSSVAAGLTAESRE